MSYEVFQSTFVLLSPDIRPLLSTGRKIVLFQTF